MEEVVKENVMFRFTRDFVFQSQQDSGWEGKVGVVVSEDDQFTLTV